LGNDIVVTREQVKELIKSEGIKPSDLFDMDSLGSDPIVRGYADDLVKERIGRAWREKQEAREELEKIKSQSEADKAGLLKQLNDFKVNAAKAQVGTLLEKRKVDRKLDDRKVKFIQNRLERFTPQKPEEVEKEFDAFLDTEVDEFNRIAKDVFGIEDKTDGDGKGGGKDKPTGAEPDKGSHSTIENKYLDPARNPLIRTT
jgi:hypothetical protein